MDLASGVWLPWLLFSSALTAAAAGAVPEVLHLDSSNFTEHVLGTDGLVVVDFYTPTCAPCLEFLPQLGKLAQNLQGIATVASVDCSAKEGERLCAVHHVARLPAVKLFEPERKLNPYTGGVMKDEHDFKGPFTAREVANAATALLHDRHISRLSSVAESDAFLAKAPALAKVLLFTDKRAATTLYKGLSCRFRGRLGFGEVHKDAIELVDKYGITAFPTLLVVKNDSSIERYEGELKGLQLSQFLDSFASAAPQPGPDVASKEASGAVGEPGLGGSGISALTILPELSVAQLAELDDKEEMRLVAFYTSDGPECAAQLEELAKFLGDLQGAVPLGRLNTTGADRQQLERYGLDFGALDKEHCKPQLVLLPFGEDKQDMEEYKRWEGDLTDAKALQQWVFANMLDLTLQITSPEALQLFMAAGSSGTPGSKTGKVLLLSSKQEVPPAFKALAVGMAGRARMSFGWIPPDSPVAAAAKAQFKAQKVPYIVSVVPYSGKDAPKSAKGEQTLAVQAFPGPMKYPYMMMWLAQLSVASGLSDDDNGMDGDGLGDGGSSTAAQAAEVAPVATQAEFEQHCTSKGGICVLGLLDGSSADHEAHVTMLKEAASQHTGQPLNFVQVDGSRQPSLLAVLSISREQLPIVAAISARRLRYALTQPPFSTERTAALLKGVLSGATATVPLQELPRVVDGGEDVGGSEPQQEVEADVAPEFDLADIMAEEVELKLGTKEEQLQQVEEQLRAEAEARRAAEAAAAEKSKKTKRKKKKKRGSKPKSELRDEL